VPSGCFNSKPLLDCEKILFAQEETYDLKTTSNESFSQYHRLTNPIHLSLNDGWFWFRLSNASHRQQFFSELPSPGRSQYTNYWYSLVKRFYLESEGKTYASRAKRTEQRLKEGKIFLYFFFQRWSVLHHRYIPLQFVWVLFEESKRSTVPSDKMDADTVRFRF